MVVLVEYALACSAVVPLSLQPKLSLDTYYISGRSKPRLDSK